MGLSFKYWKTIVMRLQSSLEERIPIKKKMLWSNCCCYRSWPSIISTLQSKSRLTRCLISYYPTVNELMIVAKWKPSLKRPLQDSTNLTASAVVICSITIFSCGSLWTKGFKTVSMNTFSRSNTSTFESVTSPWTCLRKTWSTFF